MIIEAIVIGRTTALGPCRVWDFMTLPHPISAIPTARQFARSQGRAAKHALFLRTKPRPVNSASKTTEIFGRNQHETQRTPVVIQLGDMDDQRDERHHMARAVRPPLRNSAVFETRRVHTDRRGECSYRLKYNVR